MTGTLLLLLGLALLFASCVEYAPEVTGVTVRGQQLVVQATDGPGGLELGSIYLLRAEDPAKLLAEAAPRWELRGREIALDGQHCPILREFSDQAPISRWQAPGCKLRSVGKAHYEITLPELSPEEASALEQGKLIVLANSGRPRCFFQPHTE